MGRLGLTVTAAARELGVSVGTVRRWADEGSLPHFRTPGGQRRFDIDDVRAFLRRLRRIGTEPAPRSDAEKVPVLL